MRVGRISDRVVLAALCCVAMPSVAALAGWISHDALGYDWSDIRETALLGATLFAFGYVTSLGSRRT